MGAGRRSSQRRAGQRDRARRRSSRSRARSRRLPAPPKRSILFLAVTAEEQGLLGSQYYAVTPLYPLAKTLANINMDELNVHGRTKDLTLIGFGASDLDDYARDGRRRAGAHGARRTPSPRRASTTAPITSTSPSRACRRSTPTRASTSSASRRTTARRCATSTPSTIPPAVGRRQAGLGSERRRAKI